MTDDDAFTPEQERDLLAAEHALGVLDGGESARARRLEAEDAGFAEAVARWRGRLAPLAEEVEPLEPPAGLLAAVERRIGETGDGSNVVQLRRKLAAWRGMAGAAGAIAAALALVVMVRPAALIEKPPVEQVQERGALVATMAGDKGPARLVATFDPMSRNLVVAAAAGISAGSKETHELWMIPKGGKPHSMGVMPPDKPMHAVLPVEIAANFTEGVMLAVSVEPAGGSPSGLPTGPVIASGAFVRA
ncbi:MAG: anti-sigma factor [Sphingomicrobium sp.]